MVRLPDERYRPDATHTRTVARGPYRRADPDEGPIGLPQPRTRPTNRAQWDEVRGWWIEWDKEREAWEMIIDLRDPPPRELGPTSDGRWVAGEELVWLPDEGQSIDDIE